MDKSYKLVVYVPTESAEKMRNKLARLGAGKVGNYDFASFSSKGIGRFRPLQGANPAVGQVGKIEEVEEERIETVISNVDEEKIKQIYQQLVKAHPYEEPAIEVIKLEKTK